MLYSNGCFFIVHAWQEQELMKQDILTTHEVRQKST